MLEQLSIKNIAVIDSLDVSFRSGMTVLTGETGAGKSIIIDSINMILGSRASKELIRHGKDRADVQAIFSMNDEIRDYLNENDIDTDDDSVIISRRITKDGKSTARINGTVVTLNMLREAADMLINIHGQHDNQALLNPSKHIAFLDDYAGCTQEKSAYCEVYKKVRAVKQELDKLMMNEQEKLQKTDLLTYQINEINSASLSVGEEEELEEQLTILENAEKINMCAGTAYAALYESPDGRSAYDLISEAVNSIAEISDLNSELRSAYDAVTSAMYSIEDAAREIHEFGENTEFDQHALDDTEERLDLIRRLKRKYGSSIEEILSFRDKAAAELESITAGTEQADALREELDKLNDELRCAASALTSARKKAARSLEKEIENSLHELNMEKAIFSVSVSERSYGSDGADFVEFMIATNPGEDLKPLVKIASGGELSRVMLAIKSVIARTDSVGTLIFDEIDTGVSGAAAQKIADKLKAIGRTRQVICITHLPQLASSADNHFLIVKDVNGELAKTSLRELDFDGRVKELARIVGGGAAAEDYAREILSSNK